MTHQLHAIIHGKVHGVWFRAWTRDVAKENAIVGWVRNRPDGTVEVLAHGRKTALEDFENRLREGPPLARVSRMDLSWSETDTELAAFVICH
ncbi:acylphosphatase [Pseudodesulfovibrio sp. JC047]|uniref:acylphosphatase n=1 Tax=Pseudodesulfovibrio sp. JC047 TaxID=2683199 RepID=UPI0013D2025C|nr:acylphosphatase [Pseudodesulfovibrio sp. JC047]